MTPARAGAADPPGAPGLVELSIEGVGVIDAASWEWGAGLTVITGETGSGKTMVLTGLSLVLGGTSDAGLVRAGHSGASVEGRFMAADPEVAEIVAEAGGACDEDGSLLLARTIGSAGRSRAHLGGRTVPAATLARLGSRLVAVHGQDDQHRLLRPAQQRAALDRFGGEELAGIRDAYRESYDALVETIRQRDDVLQHAQQRRREAADLRESLEAIDRVSPALGEEESLRAEAIRLGRADEIVRAVAAALDRMSGESPDGEPVSAAASLASATDALARAAEADPGLAELQERSGRLAAEADEVAADLARYLDALDADPARLDAVEQRRAAVADLRRRLERSGAWPDLAADPASWREAAAARLADLGDDDGLLAELASRVTELTAQAGAAASELSRVRRVAAERLAVAVTGELTSLAMGSARLDVAVRRRGPGEPDAPGHVELDVDGQRCGADRHGVDEIEFLLVTRDAPEGRPLSRSASGGERSRVMLALEVVFAGLDPVPTFVFDEVDAGVGGKAAIEVGHRLALLARTAQVIVVTHLAQVAAFADHHVVVRPGTVTAASISYVEGAERVTELARMLAGQEDSATAAAHAQELLDLAAERLAAGRSPGSGRRR